MTEWLTDTFVATTALLLLVLLIRGPVARHFGPGTAYFLWLLPAARLFMPSLTQEVSLAAPATDGTITTMVREAALGAAVAPETIAAASGPTIDWALIGLSLWLGGAALLFIVQMLRYCLLRDELLSDAIEIDRIGDVRVIETDRIGGPLAFGLLRRYIAVPQDFAKSFSPRERELALAHELAHHKAGDLFANMAAFCFLCLQWFNPLAWYAWSAFRFDQEAACDARVVAGADAHTRQTYGRALARTATEGLPAFAMALNSPRTIIERLRRLMMKDASKGRRLGGKLAILAAAAVALPLTATVVPVFAAADDEKPADGDKTKVETRVKKVIVVKDTDGKDVTVDVSGDEDTPFVKTIKKDGKTIVLRSNKELSEADVEKMVAEAEKSRADADIAIATSDGDKDGEHRKIIIRKSGDGNHAEGKAHAFAWSSDKDIMIDGDAIAMMIPDIDISEFKGSCKKGEPVRSDVQSSDGKNQSRVRIVMCGKRDAKLARQSALEGLREAQKELREDAGIPESLRERILDGMRKQIERLEKQVEETKDEGDV